MFFARKRTQKDRRRLSLEVLEDRSTPATMVGLTAADHLIFFDSSAPNVLQRDVAITGVGNRDVVSIDMRPANGLLYALTNDNRLYTVNTQTGRATLVGVPATPLTGSRVGIDFNPSVDRLRVITNADQNMRLNPNNGALAAIDTNLAYAAGDANEGANPNVIAAAYDRNFQGTALTTLYGIDHRLNNLVRVGGLDGTPSPNGGQVFTIGSLGHDPGNRVGFDVAADGTAYAAFENLNGAGKLRLYSVDLATGAFTNRGLIGNGLASLDALTTLSREEIVYAVTATNRLISFRADTPGNLRNAVAIRGLIAGENVTDIDFRPSTGELYCLTSLNRVLTLDTATGQATQVGAQIDPALFSTIGSRGFDFNPTVDRLRLVNAGDTNFRYNPLTFALVDSDPATGGTQPDTSLAFDAGDVNAGDDPMIFGVAYDRNDNNPGTGTTLWGIDAGNNVLVTIGAVNGTPSPNGGLLFTVGTLENGLSATVDVTDVGGFDIIDNGTLGVGAALAVLQVQGQTTSTLFAINLNNTGLTNQPQGSVKAIGTVAGGELIRAMAIAPPTIQFSTATYRVNEAAGTVTITLTRTGGSGAIASVFFSILPGTATPGLDYDDAGLTNLNVTFARGETTRSITIAIVDDAVDEKTEFAILSLSTPSGGDTTLGLDATATLRLVDND